jgi:hypothetical protein
MDTPGDNRGTRRAFGAAGLIAAVLVLGSCGTDGRSRDEVASAAGRAGTAERDSTLRPPAHGLVLAERSSGHTFDRLPLLADAARGDLRGHGPSYPMSAALAGAFTQPPGPGSPPHSTKPECLSDLSTNDLSFPTVAIVLDAAARVVCRLPGDAQIATEESGPDRYTFAVVDAFSKAVLEGVVARERSELRYSAVACERTPPPS